jgi:hypothetical protein
MIEELGKYNSGGAEQFTGSRPCTIFKPTSSTRRPYFAFPNPV